MKKEIGTLLILIMLLTLASPLAMAMGRRHNNDVEDGIDEAGDSVRKGADEAGDAIQDAGRSVKRA